jgi:hypothetical protein
MYLITDAFLPESQWLEEEPGIWINAVTESKDRGALEWPHEERHIYYVGGCQGCGCGWLPVSEWDKVEDSSQKWADRNSLSDLLTSLGCDSSWLVVCWEGDQGEPLLDPLPLSITDVRNAEFEFEVLRKYIIAS